MQAPSRLISSGDWFIFVGWVIAGVAIVFVVGTLAVRNWLKKQIGEKQRSKRARAPKPKTA